MSGYVCYVDITRDVHVQIVQSLTCLRSAAVSALARAEQCRRQLVTVACTAERGPHALFPDTLPK